MPNLVTHYLCGIESIKLLQNKSCKELIKKNQNVYNLGTQGPDILFYYGIWPWSLKAENPKIGTTLHESKVNLVFKAFIEYIIKQNGFSRDILTVYLMGFLSHNCLDSICHPYIFYRSGFRTSADNNENRYICYHRMFETAIDVLMCEKMLNEKVYKINPSKLIEVTDQEIAAISSMYEYMIKVVFQSNIPKDKISQAIKDMRSVEKILRDPNGIKKKITRWFDNLFFGFHLYSSLIYPLNITDGLDYINLSREEWSLPYDRTQKSSLSFIDLFNEACQKTYTFCDVLFSSIFEDHSSIPYALKLFGNRSYTTGVDCDIPVKFKYYDLIFKK